MLVAYRGRWPKLEPGGCNVNALHEANSADIEGCSAAEGGAMSDSMIVDAVARTVGGADGLELELRPTSGVLRRPATDEKNGLTPMAHIPHIHEYGYYG